MKKAVYITGTAGGMLYVLGILFKIQHWPGAGIALTLGALLILVFLPLFAVYHYHKDKN